MPRLDYDLAAHQLEVACNAVTGAGNPMARMCEFTRVLLREPIVNAALEEVLSTRPKDTALIFDSWRRLHIDQMVPLFTQIGLELKPLLAVLGNIPASAMAGITPILDGPAWHTGAECVRDVFMRLSVEAEARALTMDEISDLKQRGLSKLKELVDPEKLSHTLPHGARKETVDTHLKVLHTRLQKLDGLIAQALNDKDALEPLINGFSLHAIVERFRVFDVQAHCALKPAETLPLPRPNASGLIGEVQVVTSLVTEHLRLQPARRYVLERLQTYIEHFAYADVMAKIRMEEEKVGRAAKAGRRGRACREDVLQAEIDRFVFLEGFYPITHCEAARGKLDTLIELYGDVEQKRQRPLLLELKQAINATRPDAIRPKDVTDAVADARVQAASYRSHLRTNTRWADVEPWIVIAHNCEDRVAVNGEGEDVVVIYLGKKTPATRGTKGSRKGAGTRSSPA